jgi:hypothetical protein
MRINLENADVLLMSTMKSLSRTRGISRGRRTSSLPALGQFLLKKKLKYLKSNKNGLN